MAMSVGLRRGAWSPDEDTLLRRCVETFGEGRWHQVPLRAGLNRCRKSCRLRWLNYLKPNIKRGEFSNGEIDLMTRLHKLLGNRWALIAGRLPGRTANDVKNYWNTHQKKNSMMSFRSKTLHVNPDSSSKDAQGGLMKITKSNIIKPRPRTLSSKGFFTWQEKIITTEPRNHVVVTNKPLVITNSDELKKRNTSSINEEIGMWVDSLERLLDDDDNVGDIGTMKQAVDTVFNYDADQSVWTDIDIRHLLGDYSGHLI